MEIPVLNRISDFEGPSNFLISQTGLSISGIARLNHAYTFWKWGALLLLALLATFSGLLNRIKFLALSFRRLPPPTLFDYESDADSSDSSDDDDELRETDDEEAEAESDSDDIWRLVDEDFRVRCVDDRWQSGKLRLRHRRSSIGDLISWSDFSSGSNSVVKLWDNFGLGLDFQDDGNVFSLHDMNKKQEFFSGSSPPVVVAAGVNNSRNIEMKVWDRRVSCRIPQILSEWHSQSKKMVNFNASSFEKLLVGGGDGQLTVGDMRKANAPIESVEMDTWWDADGVLETDEFFDGESYNSAVGRCCDALRSQLLLGRDRNL